jgi:hypothetical protein
MAQASTFGSPGESWNTSPETSLPKASAAAMPAAIPSAPTNALRGTRPPVKLGCRAKTRTAYLASRSNPSSHDQAQTARAFSAASVRIPKFTRARDRFQRRQFCLHFALLGPPVQGSNISDASFPLHHADGRHEPVPFCVLFYQLSSLQSRQAVEFRLAIGLRILTFRGDPAF